MPLLAVAVAAVAVIASIVIPRIDRTSVRPADSARAAPDVAFTAVDDTPSPTPSPSPSPSPRSVQRAPEPAEETPGPTRRTGARRVSVQSGEIAEDSTDQDLESEEAEQRAKAREDRQNRDD